MAPDYAESIKPLLRERCYACHGALKQEAGLRLDTVGLMRQGGDSGPAVSPGTKAAESLLWKRVSAGDDSRMPPEGKPLTDPQLKLLAAWLDRGAVGPVDERPEEDPLKHWAFQPPRRPPVRAADSSTATGPPSSTATGLHPLDGPHPDRQHPLDALLQAHRDAAGVHTVARADRRRLLRRLHLDLIGLPPTREQLDAFDRDPRPDAYLRVVDELLASPQYGERWGRHWMDIWRYSDWFGLGAQLRYSQKHIWHWRDWIIESLNRDAGYDEMVRLMLAADELRPADPQALRATGFLARTYFLFNRTTWLDDTIEHTGKAFLGLTLNCTKCHDHKYDPISQQDYYRFRAIFEPYHVRLDAVPGTVDFERNGLPRVFDLHLDRPTFLHVRGNEKDPDETRPLPPGVPATFDFASFRPQPIPLPAEAYRPALREHVLSDQLAVADAERQAAVGQVEAARKALTAAREQQASRVAARSEDSPANEASEHPAVLSDSFDAQRDELWELGPGQWRYQDGRLTQSQTGAERAVVTSRKHLPADFAAKLRFRTLGGQKWKSVGLAFDSVEGREKLVYLSAVQPGSKLQVSYNSGRGAIYPPGGMQARPVATGTWYELQVKVRDRLLNVAIDGQFALAFELPVAREAGPLTLVAFDAAVEFDFVEVRGLAVDEPLRPAGDPDRPGQAAPLSVAVAEAKLAVAEAARARAEARTPMLQAAWKADRSQAGLVSAGLKSEPNAAIVEAASAARRYELADARHREALAREKLAELEPAPSRSDQAENAQQEAAAAESDELKKARQAVAAAATAVDKAQARLTSPGTDYVSLQATRKALEGPDDKSDSRARSYPATSTGRRAALAAWITDPQNPLTARVAINHIWTRHMGQPLVPSLTDFGRRAPRPVLQDVLDWLAVELMENGWRMKPIHRLIVTSQAYQLSCSTRSATEASLAADPHNSLYWHRNTQRMESQVVRDSLLALAGALDRRLGGPSLDPKTADTNLENGTFRRSLYFKHSRDDRDRFLSMFDDADILSCYRRAESIIPQQALTLANSKLALTMSRRIAAQLEQELGLGPEPDDDATFVRQAWAAILAELPDQSSQDACLEMLQATRRHLRDSPPTGTSAAARARANLVHALLNHNDFITIR